MSSELAAEDLRDDPAREDRRVDEGLGARLETAERVGVIAVPALVAIGVIANAAGGLMPGVGFWDTGEFQTVLPILGTAHPTGYPTYVLLGFLANFVLAPFGEAAFRITLLSLVAVAVAAALCVALVRRLTGSTPIALGAGIGLALTPLVWQNATRADPHPVHLAFVALLLLLLVTWGQAREATPAKADRWLVAAALVFGLSIGNHSLTLLLAPPIAAYVLVSDPRIVRRPALIAACAVALVAATGAVYLELPVRAGIFRAPLVYAHPETWDGFWYIALAEQFRGSLSDPFGDLPRKIGAVTALAWTQFGVLTPLLVPGFVAAIRLVPRYALLTGFAMVLTLGFNASYANADIERYYLGPVLMAWTWLALLAAFVARIATELLRPAPTERPATQSRGRGWIGVAIAASIAVAMLVPTIVAADTSRAQADRSTDTSAARWVDGALPLLGPNAVIVSWWNTSTPLWYAQKIEGRRPDVFIVDDRTILDLDLGNATDVIARYFGKRPVYVIRANTHDLGLVLARFELRQVFGDGGYAIYEVTAARGGSG